MKLGMVFDEPKIIGQKINVYHSNQMAGNICSYDHNNNINYKLFRIIRTVNVITIGASQQNYRN